MESGEPKLIKAPVTICNEEEDGKEEAGHSIFCFHEKIPDDAQVKFILPPGYRFVPTDVELVLHYLSKKITKDPTHPSYDHIKRVNIYKYNPQELSETYPDFGDEEWYFFTPRDRKYLNGSRPNRAAGDGYWKATGADKPIRYQGEAIGWKKSLVFYQGKPPSGDKTDWIMHEYTVKQPPRMRTNANDMKLDDWVLCKIYRKAHRFTRNGKQSEPGTSRSAEEQMVFQDIEPVIEIPEETYTALIDQNEVGNNFFYDNTNMDVLINRLPYHYVPHYNSTLHINHHLFPQNANWMTDYLDRQGTFQMDFRNNRDYNTVNLR